MALRNLTRIGAGLAAALALAPAAHAETLDIEAVYAANIDLPGDIETIVIDTLQGEIGPDAEIAIQVTLGSAALDGLLYYRVLRADAPMTGGTVTIGDQESVRSAIAPDAILSGVVRADIIERQLDPRMRSECVERDDKDRCVRREEFPIPCREMTVQLMPRLSLTDDAGQQLYVNNEALSQRVRFCRNDNVIPSAFDISDALIDEMAQNIRLDLAPIKRSEGIRIMESRKDLARGDRDAFRDAVRLTKSDQAASCDGFASLEERNPTQVSVLFNIGLCHEAAGELDEAKGYYTRALEVSPGRGSPTQGLSRIVSRQRAEFQIAAREAARAPDESVPE
ncbi:MAG: tetratricopeptide repeat protein [Pseudomonadota bacterium]